MPEQKDIAEASDVGFIQKLEEDSIRTRAYQLFEQRGCKHGHDLDDWLQAETEIEGKKTVNHADSTKTLHRVKAA